MGLFGGDNKYGPGMGGGGGMGPAQRLGAGLFPGGGMGNQPPRGGGFGQPNRPNNSPSQRPQLNLGSNSYGEAAPPKPMDITPFENRPIPGEEGVNIRTPRGLHPDYTPLPPGTPLYGGGFGIQATGATAYSTPQSYNPVGNGPSGQPNNSPSGQPNNSPFAIPPGPPGSYGPVEGGPFGTPQPNNLPPFMAPRPQRLFNRD